MTKKIEAIIREDKLADVKLALSQAGIIGLNVFNVRGRGRGAGLQMQWRSGTYVVDLLPRVQINIVLSDENVAVAVDAIKSAAHTGKSGDGMIFIYPVEDVVRISSGETGREAITYQGDIDSIGKK